MDLFADFYLVLHCFNRIYVKPCLIYFSCTAALRSLAIGNVGNSQCRTIDRNVARRISTCPFFLQSACDFLDLTATVPICTAAVLISSAAVRTTYEINNDFGLGKMSLKHCKCLAIVARLSYDRRTKSLSIFGRGHYIA